MGFKEKGLILLGLGAVWWLYKNGVWKVAGDVVESVDASMDNTADFFVDKEMKLTEARRAFQEDGIVGYWGSLMDFFDKPKVSFNEFMHERELAGKSFMYDSEGG